MIARTALACVTVLWSSPLWAAAESSTPALPGVGTLALNLVLVLATIGVAGFLLVRVQRHAGSGAGAIRIVAACPLGQRERLMVVAVGDEQLLIGVTPQGITALHALGEPLTEPTAEASDSFAARLMQLRRSRDGGHSA